MEGGEIRKSGKGWFMVSFVSSLSLDRDVWNMIVGSGPTTGHFSDLTLLSAMWLARQPRFMIEIKDVAFRHRRNGVTVE